MNRLKCVIFSILMMCLVLPNPAYADTSFGITSPCEEVVIERPQDIFDNPYCFYKGTGKNEGIEIWGEKEQNGILPLDGSYKRDLLVINNSDENVIIYQNGNAEVTGEFSKYTENQLVILHPNPLSMSLYPGETSRVCLTVDFGNNLRTITKTTKGNLGLKIRFSAEHNGRNIYERLDDFELCASSNITAYSESELSGKTFKTAKIYGYVKDSSGKALKDAVVTIMNGLTEDIVVRTDSKGYYSVKIFAGRDSYYKNWHASKVKIEKDGYAAKEFIVYPETDKSIKKSVELSKKSSGVKYKQTKVYDMGIQGNYFDYTGDEGIIAAVPFHSDLPNDVIEKNANLVIFSSTGKIYSSINLGAETPCINVSKDGKYIVTQKESVKDGYSTTQIYNKKGQIVYERTEFPPVDAEFGTLPMRGEDVVRARFRAACLSDDNKYLILGSVGGDIYCIDWKSDRVVWTANIRNQVRTIDYSPDGSLIYLSSGDGYLYCYSSEGEFEWKTYIGSWAASISIGKKYIAVSTKCAANSLRLLDALTGEQYWCYDTPSRGTVSLSPDETMVYYGNEITSAYGVEDSFVLSTKSGKVKYVAGFMGQQAAWSANGKYLVVKSPTRLYVCKAKTGEVLWSDSVTDYQGGNVVLYVSKTGKYIVAGYCKTQGFGKLYFYKKQ